jgi:hypothetical protein
MTALWLGKVSGELGTAARNPVRRLMDITKYLHRDKTLQIIQPHASTTQNLDIDQ